VLPAGGGRVHTGPAVLRPALEGMVVAVGLKTPRTEDLVRANVMPPRIPLV